MVHLWRDEWTASSGLPSERASAVLSEGVSALAQSIWSHRFGETRLVSAPKLADGHHESSMPT